MELKSLIGAAAVAFTGAMLTVAPAQAAQISGQLDITGILNVDNSIFAPGGNLDFDQGNVANIVAQADGDFATFATVGDHPTLFDLAFTAPEDVYTVDGFTFRATSYTDFDNDFPGRSFAANGVLSGNGFEDTAGTLLLSTQAKGTEVKVSFSSTTEATSAVPLPASVLMLLSALGGLGGLGFLSRRNAVAIA